MTFVAAKDRVSQRLFPEIAIGGFSVPVAAREIGYGGTYPARGACECDASSKP